MTKKVEQPNSTSNRALWVQLLVLFGLLAGLVVGAALKPGPSEPDSVTFPSTWEVTRADPPPPPDDPGGDDVLYVPAIGLLSPIVDIEMDAAGVLSPPADTDIVGWWQRSAEPGAALGQTVITGHTVHSGGGVMNRLGELGPGDIVRIRDEGEVVEYRVTDNQTLSTEEVADNAQLLFGQHHQEGRLVLVTCTDWVDGDYLSNIIVVAEPVRPPTSLG